MKKLFFSSIILLGFFALLPTASAASRFWVGGSGTWDASDTSHWSGSSGGAGGSSVPGSADTVTLDANSTGTITVNTNFTIRSLTCSSAEDTLDFSANNNSPTMGIFSCSGTGNRTINMGNGTWTLTSSSITVWTATTITNMTLNAGSSTIILSATSSAGTRTFNGGTLTYNDIKIATGTDTFTMNNINQTHTLDFTGFGGAWTGSTQQKLNGSLTMSGTMTNSYTGAFTFNSTSTTATSTITSNGIVFASAITLNASNTLMCADAFTTSGVFTYTTGGINTNGQSVTTQTLNGNNSNPKTMTLEGTVWTLTGTGALFNFTTAAAGNPVITSDASTTFVITDSSTSTKTIAGGTFTWPANMTFAGSGSGTFAFNNTSGWNNWTVTNTGSAPITTASTKTFNGNVLFSGYTGAFTPATTALKGNLTLSSGMTFTGSTWTLSSASSTGTQVITSNGVAMPTTSFTINVAGTVQLADALSMATATVSAGTFDTNGKSIITTTMGGGGAGVKTITMTNSTWTLTGTGTVWSLNSAASTLNAGGSTLVVSDTSALSKSLNFGASGLTYGTVSLLGGTGTIQLQTAGTNSTTFDTLSVVPGTTVLFGASTTLTVANFNAIGTSANPIILQSTTSSVVWNLVKSNSTPSCSNFLSIQDSSSSPSTVWYAGRQSTNVSGNTGWLFDNCVDDYPNAGVSKVLVQLGQLLLGLGSFVIQ